MTILPAASVASGADWVAAAAAVVQALAVLVGGGWALYLYLTGRRGEATVSIQPRVRLHRPRSGDPVLLVAMRVTNSSGVLFRYERATATLMDCSGRTPEGAIVLLPFAEQNPFLPVYGTQVTDPERVLAGELFVMTDDVVLEPGESVDTELAFPLSADHLGLLAMRIRIQGYERREDTPWVWSAFFYIDPASPGSSTAGGAAGGGTGASMSMSQGGAT